MAGDDEAAQIARVLNRAAISALIWLPADGSPRRIDDRSPPYHGRLYLRALGLMGAPTPLTRTLTAFGTRVRAALEAMEKPAPSPDPDTQRAVEAHARALCCGDRQCEAALVPCGAFKRFGEQSIAALAAYHAAKGEHEAAATVRQCKQGKT